MSTTLTKAGDEQQAPECRHLRGYWINEGDNFRCYDCGCQFFIANLDDPKNPEREIERWEGNRSGDDDEEPLTAEDWEAANAPKVEVEK